MRRSILFVSLGSVISVLIFAHSTSAHAQTAKPKLTLDEFFNSVSFPTVKVSPDGNSVVIETEKADWDQQIFRKELWLYRTAGGSLIQLTQAGHETSPQWSPDGQWIAFLSERKTGDAKEGDEGDSKARDSKAKDGDKDKEVAQLFLISPGGGEAFAITSGEEEVHAFAWSEDSKAIFFATRQPWTKQQNDDHKKEWKDVVRYRGDERGDMIFRLTLVDALARHAALGSKETSDAEKDSGATPGVVAIARTPLRVDQISISHDGQRLAFVTSSVSEREEKVEDIELYLVNLTSTPAESTPIRLTHNEGVELNLDWARDNRHLFFQVNLGSAEGKYEDPQPRLYWIDAGDPAGKKEVQRWFADYPGEVVRYTPLPDGSVVCSCRIGTEVQLVSQANPKAALVRREGWAGTYEAPAAASQGSRMAFAYSATVRPTEVYIADGPDKLAQARPITSFNKLFTERDLPQAKPYRWTSDDGTSVEGMLMYPPGKFEAKNLPMFVFIHGGPQDADGNHFEADWYQWDRLAATAGWLVFEPNYRGSTGYGDKFALQIVPEIVSRPGKDILTGVDALVKDGIADAHQLAIGGYSYGGYMTNWLITQTARFKAAVTGAGAVEHVANWGNDDTTFDDAYFLGGLPWETPDRYRSEGAIYQLNKVRTPTHMVAGADDIRVAVAEDYLLDRALHELNIPSDLLIFPGEGHSLAKNPWHGKIKVREELKWLTKYGGVGN
ncbi:MAG: prolyl oligopeptidase family serine peptidase [Acidobacteriia bacterium]|nr:prolyl oligopeptidase family serine peptidase [Terriglobia bacterium]